MTWVKSKKKVLNEDKRHREELHLVEHLLHFLVLQGRLPLMVPLGIELLPVLIGQVSLLLLLAILLGHGDRLVSDAPLVGDDLSQLLSGVFGCHGRGLLLLNELHAANDERVDGDDRRVDLLGGAGHVVGRRK